MKEISSNSDDPVEDDPRDTDISKFKLSKLSMLPNIAIVIVAIVVFFSVVYNGHFKIVADLQKLGTIGDFFGGILNPIISLFALIALIALLATIKLQRTQISDARQDMQDTKQSLHVQGFENSFFALLDSVHRSTDIFSIYKNGDKIQGTLAFDEIFNASIIQLSKKVITDSCNFSEILEENGYLKYVPQYARSVMIVTSVFNHINDARNISNKSKYFSILLSNLTVSELFLVYTYFEMNNVENNKKIFIKMIDIGFFQNLYGLPVGSNNILIRDILAKVYKDANKKPQS